MCINASPARRQLPILDAKIIERLRSEARYVAAQNTMAVSRWGSGLRPGRAGRQRLKRGRSALAGACTVLALLIARIKLNLRRLLVGAIIGRGQSARDACALFDLQQAVADIAIDAAGRAQD